MRLNDPKIQTKGLDKKYFSATTSNERKSKMLKFGFRR